MSYFMRCFIISCLSVSAYRFNQAEHSSGEHNGPDQCYYIPEFEAVLDCYLEMKSQGSATLDKYVEERKAYVTEMIKVNPTSAFIYVPACTDSDCTFDLKARICRQSMAEEYEDA